MISRTEFLQQLIISEVIIKRQDAIKAFCRGLDRLDIIKLLKHNPETMKPMFLFDATSPLTAERIIHFISTQNECLVKVYDWFMEYLKDSDCRNATLQQVLSFMTGLTRIAPMGLKDTLKIEFSARSPLPMAEACFCVKASYNAHGEVYSSQKWIKAFSIALDTLAVFRH